MVATLKHGIDGLKLLIAGKTCHCRGGILLTQTQPTFMLKMLRTSCMHFPMRPMKLMDKWFMSEELQATLLPPLSFSEKAELYCAANKIDLYLVKNSLLW